jgi:hypothetical protein
VVVKPAAVLPKKNTSAPPSKHPKRAAAVATSLEVHQPSASSDNVSFLLLILDFLCSLSFVFSYNFVLQTLMQKFLSLGAECIKIQGIADASQGMSIVICGYLLLYPCSFTFL